MTKNASASGIAPAPGLPDDLYAAVRALCEIYQKLDLQIETTPASAERDVIAALPEMAGQETAVRRLVAHVMRDMRLSLAKAETDPILLRIAFEDENDLAQQLMPLMEGEIQ